MITNRSQAGDGNEQGFVVVAGLLSARHERVLRQERLDPVVVALLGDAIGDGCGPRGHLEAAAEAGGELLQQT
jgi:hypothetical protein